MLILEIFRQIQNIFGVTIFHQITNIWIIYFTPIYIYFISQESRFFVTFLRWALKFYYLISGFNIFYLSGKLFDWIKEGEQSDIELL